jgi:hypothetical protein
MSNDINGLVSDKKHRNSNHDLKDEFYDMKSQRRSIKKYEIIWRI